ncbi:MAG: endonuclease/exonuclease/phosphatase family protein [Bacteroidales bacterium]|nr:endonuclease/exonuclease/phosphatase family protein [Bacteroidales bacterium]
MRTISYIIVAGAIVLAAAACGTKGKNTPIRFANYNMRVIMSADTADRAFPERKPFILKRISDHDFDIIGAQEVNDEMKASLIEDLSATYDVVGEGRRADRKGEGTPIFYKKDRFELLKWGSFWLSETPDVPGSKSWDSSLERIAIWTVFLDKTTKKKFFYINTHFDHRGPVSRAKAAEILLDKARELCEGLPVFFTGDLNTSSDTEPIAILSDNELVKDSYTSSETAPTGRKSPYYAFDFDRPDSDRGDYIFVPKDATVSSYACIDDDIRDRQYSSDHCPVLAVVTLK